MDRFQKEHGSKTFVKDVLTLFLLFFTVFHFFTKFYLKLKKGRNEKNPQAAGLEVIGGPKPFFISYLGNLYHFLPLEETLPRTLAWSKVYRSCIKATGAGQTIIVVFTPELAQSFLKSGDFGHVSKEEAIFYDVMRPFLGNGVLISEGSVWQNRRKILKRTMTFQCLRTYTKILNKHTIRFVDSLEKLFADNGQHEINDLINSSFLAIITEILTGKDVGGTVEGESYHHDFKTWKECMISRLEQPWLLVELLWKLHPLKRKHDQAIERMDAFARRRLAEYKLKKQEKIKGICGNSDEVRNTLDELTEAGATDEDIVHELNTLFFGGHETSATTTHFFFFLMALNPQHQELCRTEIDQVFNDPEQVSDGNLRYESLANLKYTERCILETLRLFPVAVAYMRRLKTSLRIDYEGKDVDVPPGTSIIIVP
ncbi:Cytochrome P450 4c21 [Orchesella cincta]|uniref:Cytochrome P450 4c21 n=1 Tax=Orchesella cincta TaxID=48709 RepID=A0A1D2M5Y2_ORCCI|nr:Cytochrome P450 4c21 [Orchesella cincta]